MSGCHQEDTGWGFQGLLGDAPRGFCVESSVQGIDLTGNGKDALPAHQL